MPAYPLSNFHEGVRSLIGDGGNSVEGYDFVDDQVNGALRTAVRMGLVPCLEVDPGNNAQLLAAPANPDTWGYLVATAAKIMIGGTVDEGVSTRAISIRMDARARANALRFIDDMLADLDAAGNVCGAAGDRGYKGLFATEADVLTKLRICLPPCDLTRLDCCPTSSSC